MSDIPHIIQNAIFVPEMKTYFMAPLAPDASHTIVFDGGTELTIGGGLDFAWRDPQSAVAKLFCAGRYDEFTLTDEQSFEWVRERLLWRNGLNDVTGTLIKDMGYPELVEKLVEPLSPRLSLVEARVMEFWAAQKREVWHAAQPD